MNTAAFYRRGTGDGADRITVMAFIGDNDGDDDEIRVIRIVDGSVVEDGIAFHGPGGAGWLRDRRQRWIAEGFSEVAARSGLRGLHVSAEGILEELPEAGDIRGSAAR